MSSSSESDSDGDTTVNELTISKFEAMKNYQEAGTFVPEQADQISIEHFGHLMNSSYEPILQAVLADLQLPYHLADFQTISLHILFQKKDLLLIAPTGSRKGN